MEILVRSKTDEPIIRIPWQRAVLLLSLGKVEVVEVREGEAIAGVRYVPQPNGMPILRRPPVPRPRIEARPRGD
jgi:hypothetical protein